LQELAAGGSICASTLPEELHLAGLVLSDLSTGADATLCISFADAGIAEIPFRDLILKRIALPAPAKAEKVLFYSGCLADFVYPEMCNDTIESLEKLGYRVAFPQEQSCCGIPARYSGEIDVAREMAKLNIDVLLKEEADYVVTICPTCTMSITHDFVKLLADDPLYAERSLRLAAKTLNYSELAARKIPPSPPLSKGGAEGGGISVTYHDACHLKRGCGVYEEPRQVLRELANAKIQEMTDCDKCCGFGGSYSIKYPEISQEVLKNKLANINETGVGILAVDCPGCKLQIEGGLEASGSKMRVEHTATLVRERME